MLLARLSQKDILTFGYASIKFSATEVRPMTPKPESGGTQWTVDEYIDRIAERKVSAIVAQENYGRKITKFSSEKEALDFICWRAEQRVRKAESALVGEKRRLAKCLKLRRGKERP